MSILDEILGQLGSNVNIASLVKEVGLDHKLAERAIAVLGAAQ